LASHGCGCLLRRKDWSLISLLVLVCLRCRMHFDVKFHVYWWFIIKGLINVRSFGFMFWLNFGWRQNFGSELLNSWYTIILTFKSLYILRRGRHEALKQSCLESKAAPKGVMESFNLVEFLWYSYEAWRELF